MQRVPACCPAARSGWRVTAAGHRWVLAPAIGVREHPATCEPAERANHGVRRFQVGAEQSCGSTTNSSAHGRGLIWGWSKWTRCVLSIVSMTLVIFALQLHSTWLTLLCLCTRLRAAAG